MYFLLCPKEGLKIEGGVLHRVYILGLFCPKQGQGLKPAAAPLYPTIGQVPPPGRRRSTTVSLETNYFIYLKTMFNFGYQTPANLPCYRRFY